MFTSFHKFHYWLHCYCWLLYHTWASKHCVGDDWCHVTWSDKLYFQLFQQYCPDSVWRRLLEAIWVQLSVVQADSCSVRMWNILYWNLKGKFILISVTYTDLLTDHFTCFIISMLPSRSVVFVFLFFFSQIKKSFIVCNLVMYTHNVPRQIYLHDNSKILQAHNTLCRCSYSGKWWELHPPK